MGRNAHLDLELISEFVQLLERLQVTEVCDVNELLAGCSKFRDIAQTFVLPKGNVPPFEEVAHPESNSTVPMEQVEVCMHIILGNLSLLILCHSP